MKDEFSKEHGPWNDELCQMWLQHLKLLSSDFQTDLHFLVNSAENQNSSEQQLYV